MPRGSGRRALVVRIGALGDVLLTRRLTYSLWLGGLRSTLLAPLRHASLLKADAWIDDVLDSESARFAPAFTGDWPEPSAEFDVALVISQSAELMKSAAMAGREVVQVSPRPEKDDASIAHQWAASARSFCEPFPGVMPALSPVGRAITSGATLIHPGSGSPEKNWPMGRFVELARRLESLGHRITWIRGPAEANIPSERHGGAWLDQPGLHDLAATLAAARLYVGNDSGVSHLAGAVGAPTLALFGPTNASVWQPDGPRVRTAQASSSALEDITVESVLRLVERGPTNHRA